MEQIKNYSLFIVKYFQTVHSIKKCPKFMTIEPNPKKKPSINRLFKSSRNKKKSKNPKFQLMPPLLVKKKM
jgi:hypothetical protein